MGIAHPTLRLLGFDFTKARRHLGPGCAARMIAKPPLARGGGRRRRKARDSAPSAPRASQIIPLKRFASTAEIAALLSRSTGLGLLRHLDVSVLAPLDL